MRVHVLPVLFAASLAMAAPAAAQTDIGDIVSGVAKSLLAQELEQNAFREAQRLNTVSAWNNYLTRYPNSPQRPTAERALANLGAGVVVNPAPTPPRTPAEPYGAASVEADLGLSRTQRTQIQTQLSALGYASGVADGLWGSKTRAAIKRWQTENDVSATGYVTSQQVDLIARQAGPVGATTPTGTTAGDDALEERLLGLTSEERREVQRRLTRLGYNTGGVDGSFGRGTRGALAAWQSDEGLAVTGYLTADQLRELRRQTAG